MDKCYTLRMSYPFYTESGKHSHVSDIIDDISILVSTEVVLPIELVSVSTPTVDTNELTLYMVDAEEKFTYVANTGSGYIHDNYGRVRGFIDWNTDNIARVVSEIRGANPVPSERTWLLPWVCVAHKESPLEVVTINNIVCTDTDVRITGAYPVTTKDDTINIYQDASTIEGMPVSKIEIRQAADLDDSSSASSIYTSDTINGPVWLRSAGTCNIRVITDNGVKISTMLDD